MKPKANRNKLNRKSSIIYSKIEDFVLAAINCLTLWGGDGEATVEAVSLSPSFPLGGEGLLPHLRAYPRTHLIA
jgi:hypothetical protein